LEAFTNFVINLIRGVLRMCDDAIRLILRSAEWWAPRVDPLEYAKHAMEVRRAWEASKHG